MKRKISLVMLSVFAIFCLITAPAAGQESALSINDGSAKLALSLMKEIAARYFHPKNRPVIKVAIFDFTDANGDITVGSRYISNRIKLAFASSPQFALLPMHGFDKEGALISGEEFESNTRLRDRIVGEIKAGVYILGKVDASGGGNVACQVEIWGIRPPFDDFSNVENLRELRKEEKRLKEEVFSPLPWKDTLSPSGFDFFNRVLVRGSVETAEIAGQGNLGEVIFLSQPICDDLNLSWQVRADGMVYDIRKERDQGSLRSRTGQVMQSRVKSAQSLKQLSYIIKNFTLVVKEEGGVAYQLQSYVIPERSDFFFIPYRREGTGLRFMYLWGKKGRSKNPSPHETGKGWKLYVAEQDYRNIMPVGTHTATATFEPIAESEYGSKKPRAQYVSRFKFAVRPGLNIYVVNYVYRRDQPEIFVRRLQIEGTREDPVKGIKRITEIYRVYGVE